MTHPTDNLIRAVPAIESDGRTLYGHFSVFNNLYKIDSAYEGKFMERVAPGAFRKVFETQRERLRVIFNHGTDPSIGLKPLGEITALEEDRVGARYEAHLFDAGYVNDLLPALRAGQLGASFKFRVSGEEWDDAPKRTAENPDGWPVRTITEVGDLWEFGPVVWGANPAATAGVRSLTDHYIDALLNDPLFVARFTERAGLAVVEHAIATARADGPKVTETPDVELDEPETTGPSPRERIEAAKAAFRSRNL